MDVQIWRDRTGQKLVEVAKLCCAVDSASLKLCLSESIDILFVVRATSWFLSASQLAVGKLVQNEVKHSGNSATFGAVQHVPKWGSR